MTFNVGDLAIYPLHGLAKVQRIEERAVSGADTTARFYVLEMRDSGTTLMVPTENTSSVGLRAVIDKRAARKVVEILKSDQISVSGGSWNRRHRQYLDKLKSGSVFELAEALRDLTRRQGVRGLSFGERRMLKTARRLVVSELAVARKEEEAEIEEDLNAIMGLEPPVLAPAV